MHEKLPVKKVLVPIDFSNGAREAFYAGISLATKLDAETYVLHVSEPIRSFDFGKKKYVETKQTIERVEEGIKKRVEQLYEEGGLQAVDRRKVHVLVRGAGNTAQEILDTAEAKDVDLIVMGATGAGDQRVGSTTERVLRSAVCSVFAVRRR